MTLAPVGVQGLLSEPHHDGSDLHVIERPDELGGEAVVRLRLPRGTSADRVLLRYERDGEPRGVEATVDEETETDVWWRAEFPLANPVTRYRWLLSGGTAGYAWVNAVGRTAHEVADSDDFVITAGRWGPEWHLDSVVYEVFPDRFASSGLEVAPPEWAVPRGWGELPTGRGRPTPYELYGGDLRGIEQRLDHVESLNANVIYLTPFFPATSTHRYDATTFDHVDPLLGGDDALRSLADAAHARGIRLLGDITLNHTGYRHEWFERARADATAPERDFYYFDDSIPGGYESWLGHRTLPKLNWLSDELRVRFSQVLQRYLELGLDGWRIDVANMVGRYRDLDLNRDVSKWTRQQVGEALVIAEHGHDFRPDLALRGWHGVMNYSGFLRPLWTWLLRDDPDPEQQRQFWGIAVGVPRLDGAAAVAALRRFRAGVPWESVLHSWNLLDSHDTARFRTIAGTAERHLVGIGLQMTLPGVPMIFAGDELGLEGAWGEDARRTMPWGGQWDEAFVGEVRALTRLRRSLPALARGGLRFVHVAPDAIAFLRETKDERLLVLAQRTPEEISLPFDQLELLYDHDLFRIWRIR
ncbi:MAG: glycoside hydrolase family 13 protein [Thermoleophilia bacterium]|nr:glycoside hydrolase family 13 protein [Thermoleophilia bacterium]